MTTQSRAVQVLADYANDTIGGQAFDYQKANDIADALNATYRGERVYDVWSSGKATSKWRVVPISDAWPVAH